MARGHGPTDCGPAILSPVNMCLFIHQEEQKARNAHYERLRRMELTKGFIDLATAVQCNPFVRHLIKTKLFLFLLFKVSVE